MDNRFLSGLRYTEALFKSVPFSLAISVPLGTFPSITPFSVSIPRTTPPLSMTSLVPVPLSVLASGTSSLLLRLARSGSRSRSGSSPMMSIPTIVRDNQDRLRIRQVDTKRRQHNHKIQNVIRFTYLSLLRTISAQSNKSITPVIEYLS